MDWSAERAAGLTRLQAYLPRAGRDYARLRNHDLGPQHHEHVSQLSPWVRHRLIREEEIIAGVLEHHSAEGAEKFIQEVCWRTYWKGWLELRPWVWQAYRREVALGLAEVDDDTRLSERLNRACQGRTGIDCFDHWIAELRDTGYLHNHARMWFASIWTFTLKLPWALGADHFLRHLMDGDAASNTLSWRWVAGLQTRGKTYLARPDNIARYTEGRFRPGSNELADAAFEVRDMAEMGDPRPLQAATEVASGKRTGLLFTEDELTPELWLGDVAISTALAIDCSADRGPDTVAPLVRDFTRQAITDACRRITAHWDVNCEQLDAAVAGREVEDWVRRNQLEQVVIPWTPIGPGGDVVEVLAGMLESHEVRVVTPRNRWDELAWPHATHGFFRFRKQIPTLLDALAGR